MSEEMKAATTASDRLKSIKVDKTAMDEKIKENVQKIKKEEKPVKKSQNFELNKKTIFFAIGIFLLFVFIQLKYMYEVWFDPDEMDIYTVAFELVKGKVLYRDLASQHMPITYFLSALFWHLGAHTVAMQRLYFYIMFAAFWTSFIFIYKEYVNKWVFILMPFVYHALLQHYDFATQILSEHVAIIGAEIFLLEFLVFLKKKDIDLGSCIRMSIAVLLSFGTAFINIFPLFYLGLGVLLLEIKWGRERGDSAKTWWTTMLKRYGRLFGIVAIPWVIMIIYMLATHSFHDFGFCAYTINRLYYPKYMAGLGGNILSSFVAPITVLSEHLFGFGFEVVGLIYIAEVFLLGCGIYLAYRKGRTNGFIAGFTVYLYLFSFGGRGFYNYHGATFIGIISLVGAYVFVTYMFKNWQKYDKRSVFSKAAIAVISVVFCLIYVTDLPLMINFIKGYETNFYQADTDIVDAITDEDERIWQTNVCDTIPWVTKQVTTGPAVSTPWMWEAVGCQKIEEFKKNPTRVVMFQIGYESWGYNMADYAPDAYYFIVNNYTYVPGSTQIWVLNSYYEEACQKLGIDPNAENDSGLNCTPFTVDPTEMPGMTAEDRKKAVEAAEKGETETVTPAEDEPTTEEVTEEPTTETTTEATTEATTEEIEEESDGPSSDESTGNGPGDVIVSPGDNNSNGVDANTEGAVQAPDGSWVIPDDSDGPGQ